MNTKKKFTIPPKVILIVLLIVGIQLTLAMLPSLFRGAKKALLTEAHAEPVSATAPLTQASLSVNHAYSPEAPPVVKVLAAYMVMENKSAEDMSIAHLYSPDFDAIEIHSMESNDGMMSMVKQDHLTIPAGKAISLAPGELHMMLIGPQRVFRDGDIIKLNLELDNGSKLNIDIPVRKREL